MRNAGPTQPGTPEDFDAVARRYWSAWSDALRAAMPAATAAATPAPEASPWQQQIDWWTSLAKNGAQPAADDTLERFNAQARQWFGTMQQVAGQFAGRDAAPADIASVWRQAMGAMGGAAPNPMAGAFGNGWGGAPSMAGFGAMPGMAGFGGMPGVGALPAMDGNPFAAMLQGMQQTPGLHGFEQWFAQVAPWLKALQGGAMPAMPSMPAMPAMPDLGAFFATPGAAPIPTMPTFGHNRERDARWQKLAQALGDLQQRMQAYAALMQRATQEAFTLFETKLGERDAAGTPLESARALFDVWIDAAEEAYARIALGEEFRGVYGALVDAQMRVRGGVQVEVEHACAQLGMPTRTELDGAHRKIVDLERQMRRLRDAEASRSRGAEAGRPRAEASTSRPARADAAPRDDVAAGTATAPSSRPGTPVKQARAATTRVAVKKAASKKAVAKTPAARKSSAKKVAAKPPAATKRAAKKVAAKKTAPRKAVATRAKASTPAANTSASATRLAAGEVAVATRSTRSSTKRARAPQRPATKKPTPRPRSAARRATPVATRPAAKRAPRPPSRRGAMSVFVDTPMPIAPAATKGNR